MPIDRAKRLDALYEDVADYDLVLVPDAPLSLALNRRLDRAQLGRFAATPRMLASGRFRPRDRRDLFAALVTETDLDWKAASWALQETLSCWDETGDLEAILEYERYDRPPIREALKVIRESDSARRDLAGYTIDPETEVAVIDEPRFNALDASVLPPAYDTVSPFAAGSFELPEFHVFESRTAIVETVVENVSAETADDVAVVMNRGGSYPALVESALEAADVPFYGGPAFADDEGVRSYLRLLRTAHAAGEPRIGVVRPLLRRFGAELPIEYDETRLSDVDHPAPQRLQAFRERVAETSFAETLDTYEGWSGTHLDALRTELDRLGLLEEPATADRLEDLAFYFDTFDVPVDRDDSGVLLADATAAATVDRPVVFYLGMDDSWTHDIPSRPWIDPATVDERNLRQFQLLLQNGGQQYYLVQETRAGTDVTPCLYFHELLESDIDQFGDLPHTDYRHQVSYGETGFDHDPLDVPPGSVETLSQSSLSTFANSPRDYFFDRLVATPDRDYFRKGNLFHDFAEFYVNHPAVVESADKSSLVEFMIERLRPLVDDLDLSTLETECRMGINAISTYLETHPPEERVYDGYGSIDDENVFADHFDRPITSPITERWFENPDLGGKGKVDLIQAPDQLLDYKSGSKQSARSIVQDGAIETISDTPDFQALLYLAHHRRVQPDIQLSFVFFHFLDRLDEWVTGDTDLSEAVVRVTYHPESFPAFAARESTFESLYAGLAESNNYRRTLEGLGYEVYAEVFETEPFPDVEDLDALQESAFADRLRDRAVAAVGDYKYVRSAVDRMFRDLWGHKEGAYFREDLDAFEAFLDEQLERVNTYRREGFPVGDPNEDRLNHRDLIRPDD